jgi:hypothetical protein
VCLPPWRARERAAAACLIGDDDASDGEADEVARRDGGAAPAAPTTIRLDGLPPEDMECLVLETLGVGVCACSPAWKSTAGLGRPDQTLKFSSSAKSKSIRLIFGRIDRSRRVLEAQPKSLRQNCRIREH